MRAAERFDESIGSSHEKRLTEDFSIQSQNLLSYPPTQADLPARTAGTKVHDYYNIPGRYDIASEN
jgi:hypothetical protein